MLPDIAAINGLGTQNYFLLLASRMEKRRVSWRKGQLSPLHLNTAWNLLTNYQFMIQNYKPQIKFLRNTTTGYINSVK